jgi:hypothetical protein
MTSKQSADLTLYDKLSRLTYIQAARQRARTEKMRLVSTEPSSLWTDYTVTEAGGQLVAAAFNFLCQVLPHKDNGGGAADTAPMAREIKARLDDCLERDEQGRPRLSVTLPDDASLDELARSLAVLLDQRAPRLDARAGRGGMRS